VGNKFRISQDATTDYRTVTRIDTATNTIYFDEGLSTGFTAASARVFAINESLADIMTVINDRSPVSNVNVSVEFNSETNGLLVVDTSGGTGILAVSGVAGSYTAADLGIQTSGVSSNYFNGTDIDPQYINANTLLSSLNQGKGVYAGKIKITDTNNITFEVDLSQDTDTTIERVITDIDNAAIAHGSGVRARINDTGDGLLIEDTTPGTGTLKIEEVSGGTTAQDLNIEGTAPSATPAIIDGSFEYKVTIDAGSTLEDIKKALNGAGLPITAAVINDGDPITPYKLTILSQTSGRIGRLVVDTDIDVLSFTTTAAAQDSVLLYGTDSGATDPQLITSSKNTITDIVPGLTLNLISTSTSPVTITVTRDLKAIVDQVRRFVETHNSAIAKIDELTYFNTDTYEAGPLFADGTILTIRHSLANMITAPVSEIPTSKLNNLGAVGIKMTNDQKLTFNEATFTDALNNKFEEVRDLFTFQRKLELDTLLSDLNNGAGVDQAVGNDFRIYARNATLVLDIDIQGRTTIGGVLSAINNASGNTGEITAAISADGFSIEITDTSTPQTRDVETPSSTTTFTESDFANVYDDDFFVGATVTFTSGTNNGEVRKVTDFDSSTGLITLDSALPAAPASGDTYIIQRNLQVSPLNNATTAGDLRIQKRMDLDENVLKGDLINLKGDPGVAFRVSEKLDFITKPEETGLISSRIDGIDDIIEGFEKTIDRIEERIERDRERLTRQFASLEMLIAQSQATMARLQALTSGLLAVSGFAIRTGET
jgi:flagellar hook-associated protein 2